jgi:GTP-binding protein HflX
MKTKTESLHAIVVGRRGSEATITELNLLLDTLHIKVEVEMIINIRKIERSTFITKGKLDELKTLVLSYEADMVVFDEELSSTQIRNLKKIIDVPILDRPRIILDIFAERATTREGKIQVELASLQKRLPELVDQKASLDQQFGVIGMKGPGERNIELSRRTVYERIKKLKRKLKESQKQREVKRDKRTKSSSFIISIVGYTNAGKSTLFNALTQDNQPTDNLLFHTLDTRTRKGYISKEIGEVLFVDTVGFIRKLPHELIEAFKSTLEEIKLSDLLLIVLDLNDPEFEHQLSTVQQTIKELKADGIDTILVGNKSDLALQKHPEDWYAQILGDITFISSKTLWNIDLLKDKIIKKIDERLPF